MKVNLPVRRAESPTLIRSADLKRAGMGVDQLI